MLPGIMDRTTVSLEKIAGWGFRLPWWVEEETRRQLLCFFYLKETGNKMRNHCFFADQSVVNSVKPENSRLKQGDFRHLARSLF